jgi:outer membrane lipase/esterase
MHIKKFALALLTATMLAGCGGSDDSSKPGDQGFQTRFSTQVTFGDSLSDVGTYAVGTVRDLRGGKFTINGDNTARSPDLTGKNWTELLAAQFNLPAPCPAQTGLQGDPARGLSFPVTNHAGCFGYAQGGARVVNPVGIGNAQTGSPLGALTVPVASQIGNHLAVSGGRFRGDEVVFVTAGANDVLSELAMLAAGASAAGQTGGPEAAAAYLVTNAPQSIASVARAADDLASLVRTQIVANGANFVVVTNIPDLASTPFGMSESASIRQLVTTMVTTFNGKLLASLAGENKVLYVDLYGLVRDEVTNPASYGLTNSTTPACGPNALDGSSLVCNGGNTLAGIDVSRFLFADSVHPTPFGYSLAARHIAEKMMTKGWL